MFTGISFQGPQEGKKKESNSGIGGSYGTLPKHSSSYGASNREGASIERDISGSAKRNRGFPTLSKTLLRIRSGKRSSSAPNLGEATPPHLHAESIMQAALSLL